MKGQKSLGSEISGWQRDSHALITQRATVSVGVLASLKQSWIYDKSTKTVPDHDVPLNETVLLTCCQNTQSLLNSRKLKRSGGLVPLPVGLRPLLKNLSTFLSSPKGKKEAAERIAQRWSSALPLVSGSDTARHHMFKCNVESEFSSKHVVDVCLGFSPGSGPSIGYMCASATFLQWGYWKKLPSVNTSVSYCVA